MLIKDTHQITQGHPLFKGQMENPDNNKNKHMGLQNAFNGKGKHLAGFLDSDPIFVYAYKKTERLIMATYMVTDILSDSDPLKNHVRESALGLLSATIALKDDSGGQRAVDMIHEGVMRVVSLLDVAYVTGRISEMNASVLKREFRALVESVRSSVEKKRTSTDGSSFSPSFFEVELPSRESGSRSMSEDLSAGSSSISGTVSGSETDEHRPDRSPVKRSRGRSSGYIGNVAKNERRAAIFNLLREKKEITVTDLAAVVTDCSQKTLQRELLQLVEEGILNKEGERRWSRYSLVI